MWLCNLLLHFFYFGNYLIGLVYGIKILRSESLGKKKKKFPDVVFNST